jgi:hypothetical protein
LVSPTQFPRDSIKLTSSFLQRKYYKGKKVAPSNKKSGAYLAPLFLFSQVSINEAAGYFAPFSN